jgi:DNA repair protein RadD
MDPWPHQIRGCEGVIAAFRRGSKRVVLTSPTGGGKTKMEQMLALHFLRQGQRVDLYTNRKFLLEQLTASLDKAGIPHGIRASGYEYDPSHRLQICSVQTEHARRSLAALREHDVAIVDEGHLFDNPSSRAILDRYKAYVLVTATPLGMAHLADELVQAGLNSELRECGAIVMARHVSPTRPDLKALKGLREGQDLTESQQRKVMPPKLIWGNVFEWYHRTNPDRRPSILFAPGVAESIWFAQRFCENGINAAHVDGEDVWLDGRLIPSSRQARDDVIGGSMDGSIKILTNRFVLREGVDLPWLYHGILATVFGGLQSYLQAGGRLLRAHPSLDHVVVQDHGGHGVRLGSLNADRAWQLTDTESSVCHRRADRIREKKEPEPWACPNCRTEMLGRRCAFCGYEGGKRVRAVQMTDGTLKDVEGPFFKPHRPCRRPDGPKLWARMYYRSRTEKGRRTFRAAEALFARENFGWPDRNWPLMPIDPFDWDRLVEDVPIETLRPTESRD